MFTHMQFIRKDMHQARGKQYELLTYKAMETEEYRIYISADGFGIGDVFCVSHDVLEVYKAYKGEDLINELITVAKSDIDRNEDNKYDS